MNSDLLAQGIQHQQAGRLEEAERIYRHILQSSPNHSDAWHLLGLVAFQVGHYPGAIECISKAIQILPTFPSFYSNLGLVYLAQKNITQAIVAFQKALELDPNLPDAHNNLGNAFVEVGRPNEAEACFRRALSLRPHFIEALGNLANALYRNNQFQSAEIVYRQAIDARPDLAENYFGLGNSLKVQHQWDAAAASFQRAIELNPNLVHAYNNLGVTYHQQGKLDRAIACLQKASELDPGDINPLNNLGAIYQQQDKLHEALNCYRQALQLKPETPEVLANIGKILHEQGQVENAIKYYQQALHHDPKLAEVHSNLGIAFDLMGDYAEAILCFHRALDLNPDLAKVYSNLAAIHREQGNISQAIECLRRALKLEPDSEVHSNLLCCLTYDITQSPKQIFQEHQAWAKQFGQHPLAELPHTNSVDANRKLRIGYVSADFCGHAVANFVEPILRCHDKSNFEIYCYYSNSIQDETTTRLKSHADHWQKVVGLTDDALAEQIRRDQIDILVDLSGHTGKNRLPTFARKPASLQVTYIGYPATTGLKTIDYRFTDKVLSPAGELEYHTEQLYRLPNGSCCFIPRAACPVPNELPASTRGYLTFGSPHNLAKLNPAVFDLWARILMHRPTARLKMFRQTIVGETKSQIIREFAKRGIDSSRLELSDVASFNHGYLAYMAAYQEIDICLDTFPANAGTTGCEALWMGVPWLTICGDRFFGRQTASVLTAVGLSDWICRSEDDYLHKAIYWSNHLDELREIRLGLRENFANSPLGNPQKYTRGLETAYRDIWTRWCGEQESTCN